MTVERRPIPGFPGYYLTEDGRVFSTRPWRGSSEERKLVAARNGSGYRQVVLCNGSARTNREVHVLVALAFHGRRPAGADIRHLDGDKSNNTAGNLRYGSRSENLLDAVEHGTHYNAKKTHCPRGHLYDYASPNGDRGCRTCRSATKAASRARLRGAPVAHAA